MGGAVSQGRTDSGQNRGMRRMPYRSPCRTRRLAGKTDAAIYPGHEAIGLVAAVGPGVSIVKEGDRVGVPWLASACGCCEHCLDGWETVCAHGEFGGYTEIVVFSR